MSPTGRLQRWVLPLAILALVIPIVWIEYRVLGYTKGVLAYPLDDAFIHMAIAKNIALHGVWGITPYTFVSASSSIIYPPLLALAFALTGLHTAIPLIVNLVAAVILLAVIQRWLIREGIDPLSQLLILLAAIAIIPLPILVIIGMEHTLQILFSFLFMFRFSEWISAELRVGSKAWKLPWQVLLYGALVTATRYEGMFIIFVACCFLLYFRKIELGLELGVITMLPIVIFGIFSLYKGNYFFPNSVLLKSTLPNDLPGMLQFATTGVIEKLYYGVTSFGNITLRPLLILLPILYLLFFRQLKQQRAYRLILVFLTAAILQQIVLSNNIWFYRYEACLVGLPVIIIGANFAKYGKELFLNAGQISALIGTFAGLILFFPFMLRTVDAFESTEGACQNFYDHNYDVGQFLHKYYDSTVIAMNDIGAVSYYTSGKNVDLWGLGNIDVARSMRNHYNSYIYLDTLMKKEKVKIAVLFPRQNNSELLDSWRKVASWRLDKNNIVVAAGVDLSYYATDSVTAVALKKNLLAYEKYLSPGVTVIYH